MTQRFRLPFGLRAVPVQRSIVVERRHASLDFLYSLGSVTDYIFNVDIYAYNNHAHPDRHVGWWHFGLPGRRGRGTLAMAFDPIRPGSVRLVVDGEDVPAVSCWTNPDFRFDPLGDIELVMRRPNGEIARLERALLKFVDRDILLAFYERQHAVDGYASPAVTPFLPELHQYKLRRLQRLFERHVPRGRVLDVGCGQSLFTEMGGPFPFHVYAGDLNFGWVQSRATKFPHQSWTVFDADAVPFRDGEFDALFAGEIIEHVTDVRRALREWWRVLKPGGVAVITTPNRERLVALADGLESPYSPDHLNELSYRTLTRDLLPGCGFEFVEQDCLYLELRLRNLFNREQVTDFLQREGNRAEYVRTMRRMFPLGRYAPWVAMGLMVVARKPRGARR